MLPGQNWNDAAKSESDKDMSGGPTEVETKKEKKDKKSKTQSGVNEEAAAEAVDYGPQKQCDHEYSPYSCRRLKKGTHDLRKPPEPYKP